jgi:hypothetical protein
MTAPGITDNAADLDDTEANAVRAKTFHISPDEPAKTPVR